MKGTFPEKTVTARLWGAQRKSEGAGEKRLSRCVCVSVSRGWLTAKSESPFGS